MSHTREVGRLVRSFPFSTLSPRRPSRAGSTVNEPTIAVNTTRIAPIPIESNTFVPDSSIPAIAIRTVMPEASTARPEVAAARPSGSAWPARRSSRSRLR